MTSEIEVVDRNRHGFRSLLKELRCTHSNHKMTYTEAQILRGHMKSLNHQRSVHDSPSELEYRRV